MKYIETYTILKYYMFKIPLISSI